MSLLAVGVLLSIPQSADATEPDIIGITDCNKLKLVIDGGLIALGDALVSGLMPGECLKGLSADVGNNTYFAVGSLGNIYEIEVIFHKLGTISFAKKVKAIPPSLLGNNPTIAYNSVTGQLKFIGASNKILQLDPKTGSLDATLPFAYTASDPLGKNPASIAAFSFDEKSTKETNIPTFMGVDPVSDILVSLKIIGNMVEAKSIARLGFEAAQNRPVGGAAESVDKASLDTFDADQNRPVGFSIFGDKNILYLTPQGESRGRFFEVDKDGNVKEKQTPPGVDFDSVALGFFVPPLTSSVTPPAVSPVGNQKNEITIEVFDNAEGKPAERDRVSEVKVRVKNGEKMIAEGMATFKKAGEFTFGYSSNETGVHMIDVAGKSASGDPLFSAAEQLWVGPTTILDAEKKGKKLIVSGAFNPNDQIFVNGQRQKTAPDSTSPDTTLIAKKGGKVAEVGSRISVKGNNNESNEFVLGETILNTACHLSPSQVSSRIGVEQVLTLQIFANGKLADPDPSSASFVVSRKVSALDEVPVTGGSGSRQGTGIFSFKYSSNQTRLDTIRASGTIKGRSFSCEAFRSWTSVQ